MMLSDRGDTLMLVRSIVGARGKTTGDDPEGLAMNDLNS